MSTRRRILKELREFGQAHPGGVLLAGDMRVFLSTPIKKRKDVELSLNQLLTEGLVLGFSVPSNQKDKEFTVKLNPEKLGDIDKDLRIDRRYWLAFLIAVLAVLFGFLTLK